MVHRRVEVAAALCLHLRAMGIPTWESRSRLRYRWGLELSVFNGVEIGCGAVSRGRCGL